MLVQAILPTRSTPPQTSVGNPPVSLGDFSSLVCLNCDGALCWHQPDPDQPSRLLGTCPACGAWHILEDSAGDGLGELTLILASCRGPLGRDTSEAGG